MLWLLRIDVGLHLLTGDISIGLMGVLVSLGGLHNGPLFVVVSLFRGELRLLRVWCRSARDLPPVGVPPGVALIVNLDLIAFPTRWLVPLV